MQMTQNESAIEQINLGFNDQEDRLLLKLGLADKTEIAVWITRRICKLMWSLLQSSNNSLLPTVTPLAMPTMAVSANKVQAIENFAREVAEQQSLENMDFKSVYVADRQTRTEEPMLAVQCMIVSIENQQPHLELQCKNGQSVKMALSNELVHAVTNMMQLATREAGWDLLMTANDTQISIISAQQVFH